jgi:hypothetical protein
MKHRLVDGVVYKDVTWKDIEKCRHIDEAIAGLYLLEDEVISSTDDHVLVREYEEICHCVRTMSSWTERDEGSARQQLLL